MYTWCVLVSLPCRYVPCTSCRSLAGQSDSVVNQLSVAQVANPLSDRQLRFLNQFAPWLTTWVHILKTGYDNLDMDNMEIFAVCNTKCIFEHFSMTESQVGGRILWDLSFSEAKQRDAAIESSETVSSLLHFCMFFIRLVSVQQTRRKRKTRLARPPWTRLMRQSRSESLASETYPCRGSTVDVRAGQSSQRRTHPRRMRWHRRLDQVLAVPHIAKWG